MTRLVLGITSPRSTPLILGQARYFKQLGYDVYLLGPTGGLLEEYCRDEGCQHLLIEIVRDIAPLQDIKAFFQILLALWRIQPHIINVGTPKMGLLGSLAAWLLRVQRRIYTCRGLRYESEVGVKRRVLMLTEKVAAACAQEVICVSQSVKALSVSEGIFPVNKVIVIGSGSSNGVDLIRFDPSRVCMRKREILSSEFNLAGNIVFGFVGRLSEHKGIRELYAAFKMVQTTQPNVRLVLLGVLVESQFPDKALREALQSDPNVDWVGFQEDVPLYMSLFDVLVLPSWREGFPTVLIQAAAMGVPVVTTDVTGCRDAVRDGFNGMVVPVKNATELAGAMARYLVSPKLRKEHGINGRSWARSFESEKIWQGLHEVYQRF